MLLKKAITSQQLLQQLQPACLSYTGHSEGQVASKKPIWALGNLHECVPSLQGDSIAAGRYLQRAAMAAEAASAQNQEAGQGSKSQPVTKLLLQETSLAAFLGHVQIGFSRATDAQGWKRLEQHLESVSLTKKLNSMVSK